LRRKTRGGGGEKVGSLQEGEKEARPIAAEVPGFSRRGKGG